MRIALVSMHTDPFAAPGGGDVGGMNVVVAHVSEALVRAGHQVDVYTRWGEPGVPVREERAGVMIHRLQAGPPHAATKAEQEQYVDAFSEALLAEASSGSRWDAIHSHHWFSGVAAIDLAADLHIPHIQSFHSIAARTRGAWDLGEQPEGPGRVEAEAFLAARSDRLIAVSRAEAETIIELGASPERVAVVHPGVDHRVFHPGRGDIDPLHLADRSTVLVAARLEPLKGIDLAIRTLAELPREIRPRLVISGAPTAGHEGYDHDLHRLVEDLGLRGDVWFAGPLTRADLARAMRRARAVLVPSHSETYGLVALEAAACGTPVLGGAIGGLRDAVDDGRTGLLVTGRDPRHWAAALERILTDEEFHDALGAAAAVRAAAHTWENTASDWVRVYREAGAQTPLG